MKTQVCICVFKRKQKSKSEKGIAIGDLESLSVEVIIDSKFKSVRAPIGDYTLRLYENLCSFEL